jgi:hypothetical protein
MNCHPRGSSRGENGGDASGHRYYHLDRERVVWPITSPFSPEKRPDCFIDDRARKCGAAFAAPAAIPPGWSAGQRALPLAAQSLDLPRRAGRPNSA